MSQWCKQPRKFDSYIVTRPAAFKENCKSLKAFTKIFSRFGCSPAPDSIGEMNCKFTFLTCYVEAKCSRQKRAAKSGNISHVSEQKLF